LAKREAKNSREGKRRIEGQNRNGVARHGTDTETCDAEEGEKQQRRVMRTWLE
jgi:hypothetical protein